MPILSISRLSLDVPLIRSRYSVHWAAGAIRTLRKYVQLVQTLRLAVANANMHVGMTRQYCGWGNKGRGRVVSKPQRLIPSSAPRSTKICSNRINWIECVGDSIFWFNPTWWDNGAGDNKFPGTQTPAQHGEKTCDMTHDINDVTC